MKKYPPTPLNAQSNKTPSHQIQPATETIPAADRASWIPGYVLLPLRLFLGITFVYAGVQKITDPHFFHKGTPDYIGNQIIGFAHGSPLHDILMHQVLSHAVLFGWVVALGEIAIGLGTLVGFLLRPAAFFGAVLSFLFFLTASWHVFPYFYGADIVFVFAWITLFLNGPLATGYPSIDGWLINTVYESRLRERSRALVTLILLVLGGERLLLSENQAVVPAVMSQNTPGMSGVRRMRSSQRVQKNGRRTFLSGMLAGGAVVLGLLGFGALVRVVTSGDDTTTTPTGSEGGTSNGQQGGGEGGEGGQGSTGSGTTGTGATVSAGGTIAQTSSVAKNSAFVFTLSSSGDPGVLIHLPNDQFVAFDATCTHAGCQVDYDPTTQHLKCPCHGAEFDATNQASVVSGPTNTPLAPVAITVDSATGAIKLK